jgi:hypothetical protein
MMLAGRRRATPGPPRSNWADNSWIIAEKTMNGRQNGRYDRGVDQGARELRVLLGYAAHRPDWYTKFVFMGHPEEAWRT